MVMHIDWDGKRLPQPIQDWMRGSAKLRVPRNPLRFIYCCGWGVYFIRQHSMKAYRWRTYSFTRVAKPSNVRLQRLKAVSVARGASVHHTDAGGWFLDLTTLREHHYRKTLTEVINDVTEVCNEIGGGPYRQRQMETAIMELLDICAGASFRCAKEGLSLYSTTPTGR